MAELLNCDHKVSTQNTYQSAQKLFVQVFEELYPEAPPFEEQMPSEEQVTAVYIALVRFHSTSTMKGDMSAVASLFSRLGKGVLPRGHMFKSVKKAMEAIFREADRKEPRYAFTEDDMRRMRAVLDLSRWDHAVFWAMATTQFWAILRVGDITGWRRVEAYLWEPRLMDEDLQVREHYADLKVKDPKNGGPSYHTSLAKRTDGLCSLGAVGNMRSVTGVSVDGKGRCSRRSWGRLRRRSGSGGSSSKWRRGRCRRCRARRSARTASEGEVSRCS
jgi:hypothetical protein